MAVRLVVRAPVAGEAGAGPAWEFEQTRVLIGRGASADVRLPHPAVSEQHAVIRLEGSTYVVVDDGSTNGTRVNGVRLAAGRAKALRSGDVLDVAGFSLTFQAGIATSAPTSSEQTAALARRLVREVLDPQGTADAPARLGRVCLCLCLRLRVGRLGGVEGAAAAVQAVHAAILLVFVDVLAAL